MAGLSPLFPPVVVLSITPEPAPVSFACRKGWATLGLLPSPVGRQRLAQGRPASSSASTWTFAAARRRSPDRAARIVPLGACSEARRRPRSPRLAACASGLIPGPIRLVPQPFRLSRGTPAERAYRCDQRRMSRSAEVSRQRPHRLTARLTRMSLSDTVDLSLSDRRSRHRYCSIPGRRQAGAGTPAGVSSRLRVVLGAGRRRDHW